MATNNERSVRIQKIDRIRDLGIQPYPAGFPKSSSINELIQAGKGTEGALRDITEIIESPTKPYATAGRILLHRSFGKLLFGKLKDQSGEIQFAASKQSCLIIDADGNEVDELTGKDETVTAFKFLEKLVDRGDFIGIHGELFFTHKGELTLFVTSFQLLSKAIMPLPEKFHGMEDPDLRYRKRYLDMVTNDSVFDVLTFRSRFIQKLREFYWRHDFIELETPVLCNAASGAAAKPFSTHHNAFDTEFFLRICSETELKKATVGKFEKVFTIGTNFRNEGSDPSHLQEFTMLEHQNVYKTFQEDMDFTEKMFDFLFDELGLERKILISDKE